MALVAEGLSNDRPGHPRPPPPPLRPARLLRDLCRTDRGAFPGTHLGRLATTRYYPRTPWFTATANTIAATTQRAFAANCAARSGRSPSLSVVTIPVRAIIHSRS